jgi:hypothetical protein
MRFRKNTYMLCLVVFLSLFVLFIFRPVSYCSASDWVVEKVTSWQIGTEAELEFDYDNNPVMVYPDRDRGKIVLAYRLNGEWEFTDIDDFPSSMAYAGLPGPSLAISPSGAWGVAYYVENSDNILMGTLKYASGVGLSFSKETVIQDIWIGSYDTGPRISLKFSPQGEASIAFLKAESETTILHAPLYLAFRKESGWDINLVVQPVDIDPFSSEWQLYSVRSPRLAFDAQGNAIIAHNATFHRNAAIFPSLDLHERDVMQIAYYSPNGQTRIETVDTLEFPVSATSTPQFAYPSLALDSQEAIGLSYIKGTYMGGSSLDEYDLQVNFAKFDGNSWKISTVEHANVGIYHTFLVFYMETPLIAYNLAKWPDDYIDVIHFAKKSGISWYIDAIDETQNDYGPWASDLALDINNVPYLAYSRVGETEGEIVIAGYKGDISSPKINLSNILQLLLLQ